ncbi:Ku protein [Pararhizobium arenae]|uniref:non-homologous end joining protein Ku n=1 Tax=Pararhizobium arenae TaxID=1856850 RepID=UPI00094AD4C2|nr:Ku protein [Pararhizobium arenae]
MGTPRVNWKGHIKVGEVTCPVGLYTAVSASDRISFNILNRQTGNRVRREFIDSETGDTVEHDEQVKGYETGNGRYVMLEPEEIAAAIPESDKVLAIEAFIPCDEIDILYLDKPYYIAPQENGADVFALLRDGMREAKVAAIASTVLFRRLRTLLIRPHGDGLIGTTLNYDYEVRPADEAFNDISAVKIDKEMLDLAAHIIGTKEGSYDASGFDDRYEDALAALVKAKLEGKTFKKPKVPKASKPSDLLQALRDSAAGKKAATPLKSANTNASRKPAAKGSKKTAEPRSTKRKSA